MGGTHLIFVNLQGVFDNDSNIYEEWGLFDTPLTKLLSHVCFEDWIWWIKNSVGLSRITNPMKSQYALICFIIDMGVGLNTFVQIFHDCPHIIILK